MKTIACVLVFLGASLADEAELQSFNENNNLFTEKLTSEVLNQHKDESAVLSGFSVLQPLAQMGLASEGEPHDELLRVVGFTDDTSVMAVFPVVNQFISSIKGIELRLANKIYIEKSEKLNQTFADVSAQLFGSEFQNIDFSDQNAAAQVMNDWVEDKTNNRIKDLVKAADLTSDTRAILLNAVYFKGNWLNKFNEDQTKPEDFYVTKTDTIKVPTMHFTRSLKYGFCEKLNATVVELPYEGEESSLLLVIPQELDGLPELLAAVNKDPSSIHQVSLEYSEIELYLPKFKIETKTDLKEALQNIGVKLLFKVTQGNLKNVLETDVPLYIGKAIQKAFIEVNELGTEATVANDFQVLAGSAFITPKTVRVDHPFYFQVKAKNTTLFNGIVEF